MATQTEISTSRRFALLGATGNTGRLVLKRLLQTSHVPNLKLSIYVRSRAKLQSLFPNVLDEPRVTTFQGHIDDEEVIRQCISGCDTIICTLGENENIPGIRVLQDAARVIVSALSKLRLDAATAWSAPRLILLSSSTWNGKFAAAQPRIIHWMIKNAFARPYYDLTTAQSIFQSDPSLLSLTLVQPSALVLEPASGSIISTEFVYVAVSYEDLAEGFVQIATLPQWQEVKAVGVSSKRSANSMLYIPFAMGKVVRGLLFQFVPGYWQIEYAIYDLFSTLKSKPKIC